MIRCWPRPHGPFSQLSGSQIDESSGQETAMSVEPSGANPTRTVDDPARPGQATSEPTPSFWSRIFQTGLRLARPLGAAGGALSLIWAAYTYSNQSTQQRRQELL